MIKNFFVFVLIFILACSSSDLEDALEIIEGVERKQIDTNRMGVNAFGNKPQFGTACEQFREIKNILKLKHLRILMNWDNGVQASPNSEINFSFYDDLVSCIPNGVDALIVVAALPGWMNDSNNWQDGNPRTTFVNLWFKKVFARYSSSPKVVGFQVWNEPNMTSNRDNVLLSMDTNPDNYLEMLVAAYTYAKDVNPNKLILNAATTAIAQNYSQTLDYNKRLKDSGVENFIDRFAIHFYGEQYENVVRDNGVADFLNSLSRSIWITESGAQGVNNQLPYVERAWPFLRERVGAIDRIYYYQFASLDSAESAYGLKNTSQNLPISDLYVYLRDR